MMETKRRVTQIKEQKYYNDIKDLYEKQKIQIEPLHADFSSAAF